MRGNGTRPDLATLYREACSSLRLQARMIRDRDRKIEALRTRLDILTGRGEHGPLYAERPDDEIQLEEWRKAGVIR